MSPMPSSPLLRLACAALLALAAGSATAQAEDPNLAHPNRVHTVQREGYTISALLTHRASPQAFRHGVALFPGHPGILRLREEDGAPRFELRGNFLVRSRRQWLDEDVLVAVIDAPSDQWSGFSQQWRESPRYGADVEALLADISARYALADWTFVGTSEGAISAFHAARMNPARAARLIQTASVFAASNNGPGLSAVDLGALPAATLWVHHADDPCRITRYADALEFAARSGKPLLTMRGGGPARGGACQAYTAHGFIGVERETVRAMLDWIRIGRLPETPK